MGNKATRMDLENLLMIGSYCLHRHMRKHTHSISLTHTHTHTLKHIQTQIHTLYFLSLLGAIQIIRDILGGGVDNMSQNFFLPLKTKHCL